ncbi:HEPN/Toprim-associated domain-containing protein [Pantoea agglomerans]|uniref:HEPN/Toprim-associated domain-containing protein n=1 Tax=Enterobacter agglomerans TaxID=549 RepID=UPI003C7CB9E1
MYGEAEVTVDGFTVGSTHDLTNNFFFKKSDRVREGCHRSENGSLPQSAFIGYRASAASIRRRMTLAGYDISQCEAHFEENLNYIISTIEEQYPPETGYSPDPSLQSWRPYDVHHLFIDAIRGTSLSDWLEALPRAAKLHKPEPDDFLNRSVWNPISEVPLINAMLSDLFFYTDSHRMGRFNIPGYHSDLFQFAYLTHCADDAVCELSIIPLIDAGHEEDFHDLEEIQRQETQPHCFSRLSIEEIKRLSDTQSDNPSLQRMCYSSIITAMEAYLGDILKREIFSRPAVKQLFVASYEPFRKQKILLSDLYAKLSVIDAEIKDALDGLSLHKIETAKNIFSSTLLTEFPESLLPFLGAAVKRRHDIVHRNGKDTEGELLPIWHTDVTELARQVGLFIQAIDAQILDGMQLDIDAERD